MDVLGRESVYVAHFIWLATGKSDSILVKKKNIHVFYPIKKCLHAMLKWMSIISFDGYLVEVASMV